MDQKVEKSKVGAGVMGMHVTLMLASAISRTRRFSLRHGVTRCCCAREGQAATGSRHAP